MNDEQLAFSLVGWIDPYHVSDAAELYYKNKVAAQAEESIYIRVAKNKCQQEFEVCTNMAQRFLSAFHLPQGYIDLISNYFFLREWLISVDWLLSISFEGSLTGMQNEVGDYVLRITERAAVLPIIQDPISFLAYTVNISGLHYRRIIDVANKTALIHYNRCPEVLGVEIESATLSSLNVPMRVAFLPENIPTINPEIGSCNLVGSPPFDKKIVDIARKYTKDATPL